uniref:ORF191 n=2 Tax=Xanthomonas hortorum pv. pelargonii TaxID=453602 RepID=Q5D0K9_9XANT|nr:ORF191 [Xanthomonas campestris pv. pelargonii]
MLEKFLYAVFGALIAALGFLVRRRIEQRPMFEQIDKQQKLLDLKKNLEASGTTLDDLKVLEDTILGKASSAKTLATAYEEQAVQIYASDQSEHMTQADMNRHAAASFHRAEERLVALVEDLREELSAGRRDAFEKSHQAWLQYREASAEFQSSQYHGGSIQPLIHASALESVTISRIVELEPLLRELRTV